MVDINTVTLEDGKTYAIAKYVDIFVLLVNIEDPEDVCIKKILKENDKSIIAPLDNEAEVELAFKLLQ